MKIIKNKQIAHELKAFQRGLEFFKQENALLKYRLSEIVDNNEENGFLQLAEYFQNELLLKDEMLDKLTKDLHQLSERFQDLDDNETYSQNVLLMHKFRIDILSLENNFLTLSKEFNEKMLQHI